MRNAILIVCVVVLIGFSTQAFASETRVYLLGDADNFQYGGPGSIDDVYVDADWREWVETEAVGYNGNPVTLSGNGEGDFDMVQKNHYVPFSFLFGLEAYEQVVGAYLDVFVQCPLGTVETDRICVAPNVYHSYENLGWLPIPDTGSNLRTLNLHDVEGVDYLPSLHDGVFNVLMEDDVAIDYAVLTLEVATLPTADADGPYTIWVGDPLILNGSGSTDSDGQIVSYLWDLDDDDVFETDSGNQPFFVVDYEDLQNLGLAVGGMYDIHLQVTDSSGLTDTDSSMLRVVPEPCSLGLLTLASLALIRRRKRRACK